MKKEVKKPSSVPVWGFAAVWLLWCLAAPMYKLWHLALCAVLSVAAAVVLRRFFPGKTVVIEVPEAAPDTGDAALDQVILQGRAYLKQIRAVNAAIPDPKISAQLDELEQLTGKIFAAVQQDPKKLTQIRQFLSYYLPTTLTLLEKYANLQGQQAGANISGAMEQIAGMLDKILVAFRRQLDALYAADVMDITAEIQVMEQMLQSNGLTEHKDFERVTGRSRNDG